MARGEQRHEARAPACAHAAAGRARCASRPLCGAEAGGARVRATQAARLAARAAVKRRRRVGAERGARMRAAAHLVREASAVDHARRPQGVCRAARQPQRPQFAAARGKHCVMQRHDGCVLLGATAWGGTKGGPVMRAAPAPAAHLHMTTPAPDAAIHPCPHAPTSRRHFQGPRPCCYPSPHPTPLRTPQPPPPTPDPIPTHPARTRSASATSAPH